MSMRRFIAFWWLCARKAFWGNTAFANDWQWLIGYPATAALLLVLGYFYAEFSGRVEMTLANGAIGALAAAFIAFVITWLIAFVGRLLKAPVELYQKERDRADWLEGLSPIASSATTSLKNAYVYGGSQDRRLMPRIEMTFAKRGKSAKIYIDHAHYIGQWGIDWTNRTRIFVAEIKDFVPDQREVINLFGEYREKEATFLRWGDKSDLPPNGDYVVLASHHYRGRVVVFCDDSPPEYFYFITLVLEPAEKKSCVPIVIGYFNFDFAKVWDAENAD